MLIYRLVHFTDPDQDIDTELKRRNRELCKPILQLFHNCNLEIQTEIKFMLQHFLAIKKHRKESTVEISFIHNIHLHVDIDHNEYEYITGKVEARCRSKDHYERIGRVKGLPNMNMG